MSRVLDLATEGHNPSRPAVWSEQIGEPVSYELALKADLGRDELSEAEIALLDEIFKTHGSKNCWDLVELAHQLREWVDPAGGAIPITYRDILKAGGKSDLEIAVIESELSELAEADFLLADR